MQAKFLAFIAMILMMLAQNTETVQLTSQTVVGNILFEQTAVYALALLMVIVALVM